MSSLVRLSETGQVTLPLPALAVAQMEPGIELEVIVEGEDIRLVKPRRRRTREEIAAAIERVAGSATGPYTTDELLALTRGDD